MSKDFQFDPILHIYRRNGGIVPSVTQCLRATGISQDYSKANAEDVRRKRELGTGLHQCLHFLQEGDLDPASVDEELKPRLDAYQMFLIDRKFKPDLIELRKVAFMGGLPYGMGPDVTGEMEREPWLLDFKMIEGKPHPSWGVQTAAYENGLPRPLKPPFHYRRASLQLLANATYKFKEWKDPGDIEEFKAALFLTWRRINRGEEPWKEN